MIIDWNECSLDLKHSISEKKSCSSVHGNQSIIDYCFFIDVTVINFSFEILMSTYIKQKSYIHYHCLVPHTDNRFLSMWVTFCVEFTFWIHVLKVNWFKKIICNSRCSKISPDIKMMQIFPDFCLFSHWFYRLWYLIYFWFSIFAMKTLPIDYKMNNNSNIQMATSVLILALGQVITVIYTLYMRCESMPSFFFSF